MSVLEVKALCHTFGDAPLFNDAEMELFGGDKMGLTGLNGAGKSTFVNMLTGKVLPDKGQIKFNARMRLGYIDQQLTIGSALTVRQFLRTAFAEAYEANANMQRAFAEIAVCKDEARIAELNEQCGEWQQVLDRDGFYGLEAKIEKTAAGLGLNAFGLDRLAAQLSGGQRAKVMLARLLLEEPDVMLFDEPTNFLDAEHIEWLVKYLNHFKGTYMIVSHDYKFLTRVTNCICDIEHGKITRYGGDYETFAKLKEERRAAYVKDYESQQKQIEKLQDYIDRNLARASTSKMAKSRRKELEKMDVLDKPTDSPEPTFSFRYQPITGREVLLTKALSVGYDFALLPPIDLRLVLGEKVAVTGFNGIGKTTFLKTVCKLIPAISGEFLFHPKATVGYYEQESVWEQAEWTAFRYVKEWYPSVPDVEIRRALASCGLSAKLINKPVAQLSGGEQAKIKLCRVIFRPYTLLILDEPTNHLDVKCVARLKKALADFAGSVIFVSHDKNFIAEVADRTVDFEKLFD